MRTIATLNWPSTASGICSSPWPPTVPTPAQRSPAAALDELPGVVLHAPSTRSAAVRSERRANDVLAMVPPQIRLDDSRRVTPREYRPRLRACEPARRIAVADRANRPCGLAG